MRRAEALRRWLDTAPSLARVEGRVTRVAGLTIEASGLPLPVGALVELEGKAGPVQAEVVGFADGRTRLMPLHDLVGVAPGALALPRSGSIQVPAGPGVLGRVLDGLGTPLDDLGPIEGPRVPLEARAPRALARGRVDRPLSTGIRAMDGLLTLGRGQRMGIFAGPGVGKSTLLGEIVRGTEAAVCVVALIGERGREVREFVEHTLGPEGMRRSVVVAATSDTPPLQRLRGAQAAVAIAERFRDQGQDVLLVMDSVTRYAFAAREVGLAAGEPPTTRGYPPSIYTLLPRLVERMGTGERGSITGLLTVLVEGDDMQDPVADVLRSLLDGHVVLSRRLAEMAHYPAIDVLASVSRTMGQVTTDAHRKAAQRVRELLATLEASRDLVDVGAYRAGSNPRLDQALKLQEPIKRLLQQPGGAPIPFARAVAELQALSEKVAA